VLPAWVERASKRWTGEDCERTMVVRLAASSAHPRPHRFTVLGERGPGGSNVVAGVLPATGANARGEGLICPVACGAEAAWARPRNGASRTSRARRAASARFEVAAVNANSIL
jgi:hypothetical protein